MYNIWLKYNHSDTQDAWNDMYVREKEENVRDSLFTWGKWQQQQQWQQQKKC